MNKKKSSKASVICIGRGRRDNLSLSSVNRSVVLSVVLDAVIFSLFSIYLNCIHLHVKESISELTGHTRPYASTSPSIFHFETFFGQSHSTHIFLFSRCRRFNRISIDITSRLRTNFVSRRQFRHFEQKQIIKLLEWRIDWANIRRPIWKSYEVLICSGIRMHKKNHLFLISILFNSTSSEKSKILLSLDHNTERLNT